MIIDKNRHNPTTVPGTSPKSEVPTPQTWPQPTRRRGPRVQPGPSRLNNLFEDKAGVAFDQGTGFQGGPSRRQGYKLALWSWLASVIDALVLIAVSCVFMLMFSFIMKTSLGALLGGLTHSQHQAIFFLEIFMVSSWLYMVALRTFMGSSIGEWACDLRLGQPHERLQNGYILKVILRSTLIFTTGVITLPLLSLLSGKDLAGVASGLRLFSLK